MTVTVYETDLGVYLNKNGDFKNLEWKAGKEMVSVEIDDVKELKGDNAVVVARMQSRCFPIFKEEAAGLIKKLKKVDEIEDKGKRSSAEAKAFDEFRDDMVSYLMDVAKAEFGDLLKDGKDYQKYKNGLGVRLLIGGAGFVASAGLALAGAWSGVGVIVGAVAMGRSAVALAQQVVNAASEAETIQKRIETNGKKLAKQLESEVIQENTAKQVAETVINKLFAVEIEKLFVTVDALHDDFERMDSKVKGLKVDAISLVGNIDDMLDKQKKAAKEFEPLKKLFEQTKTLNLDYTKAKMKLGEAEEALDKAVSGAANLMERVEKCEDWSYKNYKLLSDLKGKYNANTVKAAKVATLFVTALGGFAAGSWTDPGGTVASLKGASLAASVGLANDSVQAAHDIHVALKKKSGAG